MRGLAIVLVVCSVLGVARLTVSPSHYQVMVFEGMGEEFCKPSLCALMPSSRWVSCCKFYRQCCAYFDLLKPRGPFSFEEVSDFPFTLPEDSTRQTYRAPLHSHTSNHPHRHRFEKMQSSPAARVAPERNPLPQRHSSRPQSSSQVRRQHIHPVFLQPSRTYNHVVEEENKKVCRARFCALLPLNKQGECCRKYKQCCAYARLSHYSDPFDFDKEVTQ